MESPQEGRRASWTFTVDELEGIHQPDLQGVLCLKVFKKIQNRYFYPHAQRTLGYELWLREIRDDFRDGLFYTVKQRIGNETILDRLDRLARELGNEISQLIEKEANTLSPPQPIEQALLVRERNRLQAEEVICYLVATEVALREVVDPTLDGPKRRALAEMVHQRAACSYLPTIKTYFRQRAKYLDHLAHSPGTPFYPGRPPKRKYNSAWYPVGRQGRNTAAGQPWRPVCRPWADERKETQDTDGWADLEIQIAERARKYAKRTPDGGFNNDVVVIKPPGSSKASSPAPGLTTAQHEDESQKMVEEDQYEYTTSDEGIFFEKSPEPASDEVCLATVSFTHRLSLVREKVLPLHTNHKQLDKANCRRWHSRGRGTTKGGFRLCPSLHDHKLILLSIYS